MLSPGSSRSEQRERSVGAISACRTLGGQSIGALLLKLTRSQAVRLPKEFPFEGKEVRITKVGDRVMLEPMTSVTATPWALIDQLVDQPFMPEGREQPEMPEDRAVFDE
jgi:antitoxin VapB